MMNFNRIMKTRMKIKIIIKMQKKKMKNQSIVIKKLNICNFRN
jgi:hypothetical protein